jgi:hypothetical protein
VLSPEGCHFWIEGAHLDLAEPERIVFTSSMGERSDPLPELGGTVTFRRA